MVRTAAQVFETARHLLEHGAARLTVAVRNAAKGGVARMSLRTPWSNCGTALRGQGVLRAGLGAQPPRLASSLTRRWRRTYGRTQDGWEQTLQVNALSAALIALLTLPRLAPSSSVSIPCVAIFAERAAEDLLARLDDQADSEAHAAPGWSTEHGSRSLVAAGPECQKLQETVWAETVAILR